MRIRYTDCLALMIGYSNELKLKPAIGTTSMSVATNSYRAMIPYVMEQYDLFTGPAVLEKDRRLQKAGTTIERNWQIGGHKSGE